MSEGLAATATTAARARAVSERRSFVGDLREIVGDLWEYRDLLHQLTLRDVKIRYKQAVMGYAWALFMPALIVLAGLLVRLAIARLSGSPLEMASVAGVAVKALPWAFFVGAIGFANLSLVGNIELVTKTYFPREVLPLSATLAQTFDSMVGVISLAVALPFLGVVLSPSLLWVPLLAVLIFLFTAATALFVSCSNLFFRDVKYIVQVLLTFGIFFTPVFFEPAMFGAVGSQVMMLNPLAPLLEGLRLSVVEGHSLLVPLQQATASDDVLIWTPWYLAYSALWAVGGLVLAALMFHRLEFVFAEYV